jgi:hypothetical protein
MRKNSVQLTHKLVQPRFIDADARQRSYMTDIIRGDRHYSAPFSSVV